MIKLNNIAINSKHLSLIKFTIRFRGKEYCPYLYFTKCYINSNFGKICFVATINLTIRLEMFLKNHSKLILFIYIIIILILIIGLSDSQKEKKKTKSK